jgi:hypothetical protein
VLPLIVAPPPVVKVAPVVDPPFVDEDPVDIQIADPPKTDRGSQA